MSFSDDVKRFSERTQKKLDAVTRKIVLDVGSSLVLKSPVGDPKYWKYPAPKGYVGGRFRANWQYGLSIPGGTLDAFDPSGSDTISAIASKIGFDAAGKHHYLVNRLPYGPRLEHGWSRQAPAGMVQITVLEFQPIVREAIKAVRATT